MLAVVRQAVGALALGSVLSAAPLQAASVEDTMQALAERFGDKERKYEGLARKVDKAVRKALAEGTWQSGAGEGAPRPLAEHPWVRRVEALAEEARARAKVRKNPAEKQALLDRYRWAGELELVQGLQYGSDRPVPRHTAGFIELGGPARGIPGFPELSTNHYLYGLQEIVGWRYRVALKKGPAYEGREPRDAPELETELPGWERLRVYLSGYLPEVPLLATHELTHAIHARLAERRRGGAEEPAVEDRLLAFLDSKWNGFQVELPFTKEPEVFAAPAHALMTDTKGFAYRFRKSEQLAGVGDLPFVAITTHMQYAREFLGEELGSGDFIRPTPAGRRALERFHAQGRWLTRYKSLIDEFVRAVLVPDLPYPEYLSYLDYPDGRLPTERRIASEHDVPRRHALLVWAFVEHDPVKLADFLYDEVLSKEANAFPNDVSLPVALTLLVREREAELLAAVAARTRTDGADLERELWPFATYRERGGEPASDYLVASYLAFHAPVQAAIRAAAREVVAKELD